MSAVSQRLRRRLQLTRALRQPTVPVRPPAPRQPRRLGEELLRGVWQLVGHAVARAGFGARGGRRVHQRLDVTAARQHEPPLAPEQPRSVVRALPRDDVIGEAGDEIGVEVNSLEIDRLAEDLERAGVRERVIEPDVDEIAMKPRGQAHRVLVPVEDVERRRLLTEQVVVDDVVPHQVVRAQPREHALERLPVEVTLAR